MKKLLLSAILALAATAAQGEAVQVSGKITALDRNTHRIALDNGLTYLLQADLKTDGLAVGQRVTIATETQDGVNMVKQISKG